MTTFELASEVPCSADALFAYHARKGALTRLTPPFEQTRDVTEIARLADGERAVISMAVGPAWTTWVARTESVREGRGFVDVMERGPFATWRHEHVFEPLPDVVDASGAHARCRLVDRIEYTLPAGALGDAVAGAAIHRRLARTFAWRHATTRLDHALFAQLAHAAPRGAALVVGVTGASGLVGRELCALLRVAGHDVVELARTSTSARAPARAAVQDAPRATWDPGSGDVVSERALDVVVHLAGEPIGEGRLDAARKERARASRVDATRALVAGLARMASPPRAFIAASAVGIYGERGDDALHEDSATGAAGGAATTAPHARERERGFLAQLCAAWEDAARTAEAHGMRWASLRIGIALSPAGGALAQMLPPFRAGAGAVLGSGAQWAPYVAIDDVAGLFLRAVVDERVRGPLNCVGPEPLTNRDFTRTLARVLRRPAIARAPAFALRALFGELADEALLISQRAVPSLASSLGHVFRHATTEAALRHVLGRAPSSSAASH